MGVVSRSERMKKRRWSQPKVSRGALKKPTEVGPKSSAVAILKLCLRLPCQLRALDDLSQNSSRQISIERKTNENAEGRVLQQAGSPTKSTQSCNEAAPAPATNPEPKLSVLKSGQYAEGFVSVQADTSCERLNTVREDPERRCDDFSKEVQVASTTPVQGLNELVESNEATTTFDSVGNKLQNAKTVSKARPPVPLAPHARDIPSQRPQRSRFGTRQSPTENDKALAGVIYNILPTRQSGADRALLDDLQYVMDGISRDESRDVQKCSMLSLARSMLAAKARTLLISQRVIRQMLGGVLSLSLPSSDPQIHACSALVAYMIARDARTQHLFESNIVAALLQLLRRTVGPSQTLVPTRKRAAPTTADGIDNELLEILSAPFEDESGAPAVNSVGSLEQHEALPIVSLCICQVLENAETVRTYMLASGGLNYLQQLASRAVQVQLEDSQSIGDVASSTFKRNVQNVASLLQILEHCAFRSRKNQIFMIESDATLISRVLETLRRSHIWGTSACPAIDVSALENACLRLLINMTNANVNAVKQFSEDGGALVVLKVLLLEHANQVGNFDRRILCLCLLVNVWMTCPPRHSVLHGCYVDAELGKLRILSQGESAATGEQHALKFLVDLLYSVWHVATPQAEQSTRVTECKITVAYLSLLIGVLLKSCPANSETMRNLLPNRSVAPLREVLQEFSEVYKDAGPCWEAMDRAYQSIVDVLCD